VSLADRLLPVSCPWIEWQSSVYCGCIYALQEAYPGRKTCEDGPTDFSRRRSPVTVAFFPSHPPPPATTHNSERRYRKNIAATTSHSRTRLIFPQHRRGLAVSSSRLLGSAPCIVAASVAARVQSKQSSYRLTTMSPTAFLESRKSLRPRSQFGFSHGHARVLRRHGHHPLRHERERENSVVAAAACHAPETALLARAR
jgi:hypothetical protein